MHIQIQQIEQTSTKNWLGVIRWDIGESARHCRGKWLLEWLGNIFVQQVRTMLVTRSLCVCHMLQTWLHCIQKPLLHTMRVATISIIIFVKFHKMKHSCLEKYNVMRTSTGANVSNGWMTFSRNFIETYQEFIH